MHSTSTTSIERANKRSEVENKRVSSRIVHTRTLFSITAYETVAQPNFLILHMLFIARWISSAGGKKVKSCAAVETSSVRTLTCILALFTIDCCPHTALTTFPCCGFLINRLPVLSPIKQGPCRWTVSTAKLLTSEMWIFNYLSTELARYQASYCGFWSSQLPWCVKLCMNYFHCMI